MRTRMVFGAVVTAVAAVILVSASGAATTKVERPSRIDVSTRAAVIHYLRSIQVNPAGVVIQHGTRNYAGPDCPGHRWNCTSTTHPVVQVASSGGRNVFTCSTAQCAVVQVSQGAPVGLAHTVTNTARCVKEDLSAWETGYTHSTRKCSITQSSAKGNNLAVVFENIQPGLIKSATSKATIRQTATGASNGNTACLTQNVKLIRSGSGPSFTSNLNAHQTARISQDATGSGANSAQFGATRAGRCDFAQPVTQNQVLKSVAKSKGAITQNENANGHGANVTIDIEQNQGVAHGVAGGTNNANFVQNTTLTAIANSSNGPISQKQSSLNGGLLGTINQDSSGGSTANTAQHEIECVDAAKAGLTSCNTADPDALEAPTSLTQVQFGPVRKGLGISTQTRGGSADTFTIDQTSQQDDDQGSGSTQTEDVEGDCSTDGFCTVGQTVTVDGHETNNFATGSDLDATTSCAGSDCVIGGGGQ